ncbi:MAG: WxL domain-containing protein [Carnobacterium maltaromaticum]
MKNIKIILFNILFILGSSLFFLIQSNVSVVEAANDSKITFDLYGYYGDGNTGSLVLDVPDLIGNQIKLSYSGVATKSFDSAYPGTKYMGVTVLRDGESIFTISVNGDTKQKVLIDKIKNISVLKGDILCFYFAQPTKQRLLNVTGGQPGLNSYVAPYFKQDMYYMITQDGFIPVNNAISIQNFHYGNIYNYINTLLYKHIIGYSEALIEGKKQYNPTTLFQPSLPPNEERFFLIQHEVGVDHKLTIPKNKVTGFGETTFGEVNELVKKIPVRNGNIYQVYCNDSRRVGIWKNGVLSPLQDLTQKINYFELTENNGLVELDFYKVKPNETELVLELGSDSKTIKVTDVTNISNYSNLSASFKTDIKTDTLGVYDQSIVIKQNLLTNNNYLEYEITSKINIVDTTKPTAVGKVGIEIPIYSSLPTNPADLLENIQDNSDVKTLKIEYLDENGDTSIPGVKVVKIRLTDISGNFSDISVPITIVPGTLTISKVPHLNFGQIKIGSASKNLNQTVSEIEINDFRGTKEGWTLQVSKSDFLTQDGKKLNSGISIINGVVSSMDQQIDGVSMYDVILNNFPQPIMQAQKNSGIKKWVGTLKKENVILENISPDARIGSYESIINWTLLNAP